MCGVPYKERSSRCKHVSLRFRQRGDLIHKRSWRLYPYLQDNCTHYKTLETWIEGVGWNIHDTLDCAVIACGADLT